jgi:hypothetical protein
MKEERKRGKRTLSPLLLDSLLLLPLDRVQPLLLNLLQDLPPPLLLLLLKLLPQPPLLVLKRRPRLLLPLLPEARKVRKDPLQRRLDREAFDVLRLGRLGAVDLSGLERLPVASLLTLVVELDEGDLFLAERTLDVVDALRGDGELLGKGLLLLLELLDLKLDEFTGGLASESLFRTGRISTDEERERERRERTSLSTLRPLLSSCSAIFLASSSLTFSTSFLILSSSLFLTSSFCLFASSSAFCANLTARACCSSFSFLALCSSLSSLRRLMICVRARRVSRSSGT